MKLKKVLAILLILVFAVSSLSACSTKKDKGTDAPSQDKTDTSDTDTGETGDTGDADTGKTDSDVSEETLEPVTFKFYNADGSEDPWTDPVAQKITEATGVTLETDYPVDGDDQRISLMIASGEYPDLIFAKGDADALIDAGVLIDMTELIDQYGPNIKAMYGEQYSRLKYSLEDPSIYQLCCKGVGNIAYTTSGTAQLQYAVLEHNNWEIPKTLEQYEAQIKSYLEANPKTEDGQDNIGLSISCADWHWYITLANPAGFIANASPDNGQWIIDDEDSYKAVYKHSADGQKEYFQWLNRMYHEGILDKNFATQTHDDYIAKISSGRVLGLLDADWDYNDGVMVLKADGKYMQTYAGLPVTMSESEPAASLMDQGLSVGWGVGITTSCKDPVRAVKFLNWLCSDEAQVLLNWGIEGVNYEIDENGQRYRTAEEISRANTDTEYKKTTGVGFHNYPFPCYGNGIADSTGSTYTTASKESVISEYDEAQKLACEKWGVEMLTDIFKQSDEFEIPPYSAVWAMTLPQDFTDITSELDNIAWTGLVSCVLADEDKFEEAWNTLQSDLEGAGAREAEEMLSGLIQEKVQLWNN